MVRIRLLSFFFALLTALNTAQAADDIVNVRASAKDDYTRIVFEWPKPPSYVTDQTTSSLTLKFQSAAQFKQEGSAPTSFPRVVSYQTPDAKTVQIGYAPGQTVRHFEIGNRIIVDIRGPATTKNNAPPAKEVPKPEKQNPEPVKTETKKAEPVVEQKKTAEVVAPPMPSDSLLDTKLETTKSTAAGFQIQVTSTQSIGIAAFERFNNLWIVIDQPDYPLAPQLSGPDAKKLGTFERVALKEATAFRLALPDQSAFHVVGGGLVWKITAGPPAQDQATKLKKVATKDQRAAMLWPASARRVIDLNDPVIGDTIKVATVDTAKYYSGSPQSFPEFGTLPSYAGLAIESNIDNLDVEKQADGILINAKNGLSVSSDADTAYVPKPVAINDPNSQAAAVAAARAAVSGATPSVSIKPETNASGQVFKFVDWMMGDEKAMQENRRLLMAGLADKKEQERAQDLMTLGKMELAHGRGPEAVGYFDLAGQFLPDLASAPEFEALYGAAKSLSGEYEEGLKNLSSSNLKGGAEIALWKSYALANLEDWKQAAENLPTDFKDMANYPDAVRMPLALTLSEVALRNGDLKRADDLMKIAKAKDMPLGYQSALDYMRGEYARQQGKIEDTETIWKKLKDGPDDLYRAKAGLALTSLQFDRKEIKPEEAIDRMEGLRYAWRGDELETSVNYKLGQLYLANNDPLKGLSLLRQAASLAPESDQAKRINAEMAATYVGLFEPNKIKDINPVDAVTLYNEFSNLATDDQSKDKIVRQLSDKLVDADLLTRASALLQGQVNGGKLKGADGAQTSIRLASIYLQDGKPDKTVAALNQATAYLKADGSDKSEKGLVRQIAILRAQALAADKKPEEAFAILAGLEQTADVLKIRADIAWSNKRWQDAADSLEAVVNKEDISASRPASEDDANMLLNWAVACYLADNRYVLANMREKYSTAMAATSKANQFEVVTRPRQSTLVADRDSINSIIEETDIFKGFVDSSRKVNAAATQVAPPSGQPALPTQSVAPVKEAVPPQAPTNSAAQ